MVGFRDFFPQFSFKDGLPLVVMIAFVPFILLIGPVLQLINYLLKIPEEDKGGKFVKDGLNLKILNSLIIYLLSFIGCISFFIFTPPPVYIFYMLLMSVIVGIGILILMMSRVGDAQLNSIIRQSTEINIPINKARKYIILVSIISLITSLLFETSRHLWLFWVLCLVFILLSCKLLWIYYKHIFIGGPVFEVVESAVALPQFNSSRTFAVSMLIFMVIIIVLILIRMLI